MDNILYQVIVSFLLVAVMLIFNNSDEFCLEILFGWQKQHTT